MWPLLYAGRAEASLYFDYRLCNNGAEMRRHYPLAEIRILPGTVSMKYLSAICLLWALSANAVIADVEAGKSTYAARGCIGCHGPNGASTLPNYPSLKGRSADFVRNSLTEFRSGARKSAVMNAMAAGLKDADIRNLADYIASLE